MANKTITLNDLADRCALDFIINHTKLQVDGKEYRVLVNQFKQVILDTKKACAVAVNAAIFNEQVTVMTKFYASDIAEEACMNVNTFKEK